MSSYDAPPEDEETHLLGLLQRGGPVRIGHSATRTIADRLVEQGEAMIMSLADGYWLEITSRGRRRLNDLHETRSPRDAWDALYGQLCMRGDRLWASSIMREIESIIGAPLPKPTKSPGHASWADCHNLFRALAVDVETGQ